MILNYEIIMSLILYIGWPILIIGSINIAYQAWVFYTKMGSTPIAKLVSVFAISTIVTMYSLGLVSTMFMMTNTADGVLYVLPVFSIWFIFMIKPKLLRISAINCIEQSVNQGLDAEISICANRR